MHNICNVIQAIVTDNVEELQRLLRSKKYNLSQRARGATALSFALQRGYLRSFILLLDAGAPVNQRSRDHLNRVEPPIISAVRLGLNEFFEELLLRGVKLDVCDFYNKTPLWFATNEQKIYFVKALLGKNCSICFGSAAESPLNSSVQFLCYKTRRNIAVELVQAGLKVDLEDSNGRSPFFWALHHFEFSFARLLIAAGGHFPDSAIKNIISKQNLIQDQWILNWLQKQLSDPLSLQQQCRSFIRNYLRYVKNRDIRLIMRKLPLPPILISYLMLEDFEDVEEPILEYNKFTGNKLHPAI